MSSGLRWDVTSSGNGERGTGVWELMYSGNPLENSKWRTKQKKRLEQTIWVNASFYRLYPQMASAFLSEQTPISTGINKACNRA